MNVFVLDYDPTIAATMHCDRHVVKMILEYGQLLSTAHRMLDGTARTWDIPLVTGKIKHLKFWTLPGEVAAPWFGDVVGAERWSIAVANRKVYAASHFKHPAALWARQNTSNYLWLANLFEACLLEYTHRYGRKHSAETIREYLSRVPNNIAVGDRTPFPQSMPIEFKDSDAVVAYQNYYMGAKLRFARWTNRAVPNWFANRLPNGLDVAYFERTR